MIVENYLYPFEKGKPSLFVIGGSPFQALCAVEAIRDLEIDDYMLVVCLRHSMRNDQTLNILNRYGIIYECIEQSNVLSFWGRIKILKYRRNKYKRVFVGDFRALQQYYCALRYASNKCTIVSLDDGSCNVSLLKGVYKLRVKSKIQILNYWYFDFVAKLRSITKDRYLYTIFCDIPNTKYLCFQNKFKNLQVVSDENDSNFDGVFFVGTNTLKFAEVLLLRIDSYYQLMDDIFDKIKELHHNQKIVYIPHGADDDEYMKRLCIKNNFIYDRPDTLVELYMLNLKTPPKYVYGFTSTALFTIKKMFPNTEVINILFHGDYPYYERRKNVSEYYSQHKIKTIELKVER